jgi:hypothetical protein
MLANVYQASPFRPATDVLTGWPSQQQAKQFTALLGDKASILLEESTCESDKFF